MRFTQTTEKDALYFYRTTAEKSVNHFSVAEKKMSMGIFEQSGAGFKEGILTPPRLHLSLTQARNPFDEYLNLNISMFRDSFSDALLSGCCAILFPYIRLKIKSGIVTNHNFFNAHEYSDPFHGNQRQFKIYEPVKNLTTKQDENRLCAFNKALEPFTEKQFFANEIVLAVLPDSPAYKYSSRKGHITELKIAYNSYAYPELSEVDFEIQAVVTPLITAASFTQIYSRTGDVEEDHLLQPSAK